MADGVPDSVEYFKEGDSSVTPFSAEEMNKHATLLNALRWMEVEGYEAKWSQGRVVLVRIDKTKDTDIGSSSGSSELFLVIRKYKDYVVGKRVVANLIADARGIVLVASDPEVRIAKPFEIRTSHWAASVVGAIDGYSYVFSEPDGDERTANLLDASEFGAAAIASEQEISPPYILNKTIICAHKVKQGAILRVEETVSGAPQTFTIEYVEEQGRVFINKERKIRVCIEGSSGPWFALFRPSGAFREE